MSVRTPLLVYSVLYLVAVGAGFAYLDATTPAPGRHCGPQHGGIRAIALSSLPRNHRLAATDIQVPDRLGWLETAVREALVGRYLVADIHKGCPLSPAQTSDRPTIIPSPGQAVWTVQSRSQSLVARQLRPQQEITFCVPGQPVRTIEGRVLAVVENGDSYEIVIEMDPEELIDYTEDDKGLDSALVILGRGAACAAPAAKAPPSAPKASTPQNQGGR